jgi:hypothetical protein
MARVRAEPYVVGEVARLYPPRPSSYVEVWAPDGLFLRVPVERHAEIWLAQPGVWAYEWESGENGQIVVREQQPVAHQADDAGAIDVSSLPPLVVTRHPRY